MGSLDGRTLGHFRVERLIGSGGMGAVYEAVDEKLERQVALKVLLQEGDSTPNRKRFLREARLAAKLTHPNIATVYEVGEFENHLYIVMELLEGQALRKLLGTQRLRTEQSLGIARDVARALARAHTAGVTHRDIKPENVFITTPTPNVLTAKVLDFGLARQQTAKPRVVVTKNEEHTATETTAPGDILGTPGYWSPEQARSGDVDQRTDIFSFGMVLYEMLTGRRAFKANATVALVLAVTRHEPEPIRKYVPGIVPELEELVARCIKKDPAERYADGSELLEAVEEVARVIGRTSPIELDDATAADEGPPVKRPSVIPRAPESSPVASAPTPGPTSFDHPRAKRAIVVPPERMRLFAAIGAGIAGAGLLLILVAVLLGGASTKTSAAAEVPSAAPLPAARASVAAVAPVVASASAAAAPAPAPAPPSAPEEPATEPAATATITPTPLAAPAATMIPTPLAVAGTAATPAAAGGATPASAPRAHRDKKADCAQPFTVDAKGVKIPKLHCL